MLRPSTLPNLITVTRIALTPVIFALIFVPTFSARLTAFVLFLIAAFSDLWDGHLARKYGWISDFGKLVDPIADKLLLVATFLPVYILHAWVWEENPAGVYADYNPAVSGCSTA